MKLINVRKLASGRSISRILSGELPPVGDHLSVQPTRDEKRGQRIVSAWPCFRWGLSSRQYYYQRWWSFTPPFHPYFYPRTKAVLFCDPIRQIAPPRDFLGIVLYEVRTFLDSLSRDRPTSLRRSDNTLLPSKRQLWRSFDGSFFSSDNFLLAASSRKQVRSGFLSTNNVLFISAKKFLYGKIRRSLSFMLQEQYCE